ncbi:MAG: HEAT repeat domain-containing protein [Anaerolineales bacterium]
METETKDVVARWHSAAALGGDLHGEAVDTLLDSLGDPHPFVRWHASKALAETARTLQGQGPLGSVLGARRADHILTFKEFWRRLERGMQDGNARCRAAIADGLGLWGHPQAIAPLVSMLQADDDPLVRVSAADALGRIGDRQAARPLGEALTDESLWVRSASAHALGQIAAPESVDALEDTLADAEPLVRGSAAAALGHIATDKARKTLIQCLQNGDPAVRWYAARGLAKIGGVDSLVPLEDLLEDETVLFDRSIGEMARSAIAAIKDRSKSPWHWLRRQFHIIMHIVGEKRKKGRG